WRLAARDDAPHAWAFCVTPRRAALASRAFRARRASRCWRRGCARSAGASEPGARAGRMNPELLWFAAGLVVAGLAAGFVGGLFGIGGGIVIVPALYFVFTALGIDEAVRMHVAVGTSLSTIIATSWRSLAAHTKAGAVDFDVLKTWTPWISFGALLGAAAAGIANTEALLLIFGGGLLLIAAQMGLANPNWRAFRELPQGIARAVIASALGLLSALMGIGGGAIGVTVMTLCGRPIHQAVATASGF